MCKLRADKKSPGLFTILNNEYMNVGENCHCRGKNGGERYGKKVKSWLENYPSKWQYLGATEANVLITAFPRLGDKRKDQSWSNDLQAQVLANSFSFLNVSCC